ncbi:hypothetical protein [Kitasatospora sp. MBT66]|uniref:hypothetical protein n=1 Tax=Kitasatospora sp. MBT66 TaxID=1444769 RepID=UPI0005B88829|nr:hypothetical protein [Kitasatospora sp. MBT66]
MRLFPRLAAVVATAPLALAGLVLTAVPAHANPVSNCYTYVNSHASIYGKQGTNYVLMACTYAKSKANRGDEEEAAKAYDKCVAAIPHFSSATKEVAEAACELAQAPK